MKKCLLIIFIFLTNIVTAQDFKKIKNFLTIHTNKAKVTKDSTLYSSKIITSPIISFSPETSLGVGIGAKYLFKFKGSGKETRTSNMPVSLRYTLKNQFIFSSGFEIFTNREAWVITGNIKFQNYPRFFYDIGQNTPIENKEEYSSHQFLFEPIVLKKIFLDYLYVGGGLRYNKIYNVKIKEGGILDTEKFSGYKGSTSSGSNKFKLTRFDLRYYKSLNQSNRDILAFQFLGSFSNEDVPFAELPLLGGSEIMRGYREGRYIDRNLLAGQIEYRKTFKNSRWGLVGFVGSGDVFNNINQLRFKSIKPNFGFGVRFMVDKEERLNLRGDWGFGNQSNHLYFNISDTF